MNMNAPCPCCSGKDYGHCCFLFHSGTPAKSALELMRSRFAAYALNIPDYIIATTHPGSPQYIENLSIWRRRIQRFSEQTQFQKLDVLDFKEKDALATVTFTATLTSLDGQDGTFTEQSFFEKRNGKWLYRGGRLAEGHAPNLITTGQLRLLPLAYYGDAVLRRKADHIEEIDDNIKNLVEEMIETMDASYGVGLAAPQVHHSIRLFIVRMPVERDEEDPEQGEILVFINPTLSEPSKATWTASEGCLSIPTIRAEVERPKEIVCEYTTLQGERIKKKFSGWDARAVMHENDHLNGVLHIDRADAKERKKIEPLLKNLEKRLHDGLEL